MNWPLIWYGGIVLAIGIVPPCLKMWWDKHDGS